MSTEQQDHTASADAAAIWRCMLGQPADLPVRPDSTLAARLAARSSRALIEALLAPLGVKLAGAANDLLLSRLGHAAQLRAYRRLDDAGLKPVALKGFANAHRLYDDDPVPRIVGDLDLLIERRHLKPAIELFAAEGFRFAPADKRWGVIGEASFAPFHSADGVCNIDFHVSPDSWPLPLGLSADDVRAKARTVAGIRMPSDEHALLIAVANAAKDKFGWRTLGKALDLARLLNRSAAAMNWDEIQGRARMARLEPAMACFFALLRELGGEAPKLPGPFGGALFRALAAEWRGGFADEPTGSTMLAREAMLAHTAATAVTLNFKRLAGLFSPNDGVPPEGRAYV